VSSVLSVVISKRDIMIAIKSLIRFLKENYLITGLTLVFLFRLAASQAMGLLPQDAYYYFYSEHLALSYFDHPPMIAYILKIFTAIFGISVHAVKLADFTITLFSLYSFYYLGKLLFSKRVAQISFILFGSTVLVTLISIISTPDVPLILFWTLSLIMLYKALFEHKTIYWILAGIMMGIAFDSKYTALFLPLGTLLFLLLSRSHRKYLFSKELFLMALFFRDSDSTRAHLELSKRLDFFRCQRLYDHRRNIQRPWWCDLY